MHGMGTRAQSRRFPAQEPALWVPDRKSFAASCTRAPHSRRTPAQSLDRDHVGVSVSLFGLLCLWRRASGWRRDAARIGGFQGDALVDRFLASVDAARAWTSCSQLL